jgi:flagellar assembly protein FliH
MGALPQKFGFDTEFDAGGEVTYIAPRTKRSYTPDEVEAVRRAALSEGERMALESLAQQQVRTLNEISAACARALPRLAEVAHAYRGACATLAMACGRAIADAALDEFPEAPLRAAIAALTSEIDAQPRLIATVPPGMSETLKPALEEAAAAAGFAGTLVVREDQGMGDGAFALDFGDGQAAFDPDAAAERVAATLASALAADGLHAEPLLPASNDLGEES